MLHRLFASLAAVAVALAIPAAAQTQQKGAAKKYTAPRTPWGDPDLQGWLTNIQEQGTPLERPEQFAGRSLDDVRGEELAALKRDIQKRTVGNFQGPLHAPENWWQTDLDLVKGSQAWFVIDPPDGKIPPTTAEAKARAAARAEARRGHGPADSWEDRSLYDRCITRGMPGSMMPVIYGNSYQIVQSPGYVAIRYEMVHETRVIPTDGRPHASSNIRSYMGDAVGHWEGDTLVVETRNFRDEGTYRNANGATLRVVERFTRTAPNKVQWTVTLDDPQTWTRPWTFTMPLTMDDSQPVLEYSCHEGNLGLVNILKAARAEERKAVEANRK